MNKSAEKVLNVYMRKTDFSVYKLPAYEKRNYISEEKNKNQTMQR